MKSSFKKNRPVLGIGAGAAFAFLVLLSPIFWLGGPGCVDKTAPVSAFVVNPCPTPILFMGFEDLSTNIAPGNGMTYYVSSTGVILNNPGTGTIPTAYTATLSLSHYYVTQGQYSLDVNVNSCPSNGYNQNILQLTGISPSVWSNITQLILDVTVDPSVVAGASYSEFTLIGSNNTTAYFSPISTNTPPLVAGSQSVTWNIAFAPTVGTIQPTDSLYELYFVHNRSSPGPGQGIGNIYVDNIRLIQNCP